MIEQKENIIIEKNNNFQLKKVYVSPEIENTNLNFSPGHSNNFKKIASAFFYALASIMIMFSNKIVLTKYRYLNYNDKKYKVDRK